LPTYQKNAGVPKAANPGGKVGRGVPDICGNADSETGFIIRVDGANQVIGGTSAVSPLWAGLIARAQFRTGPAVGFLTPKLYSLKASANALRDITDGGQRRKHGEGIQGPSGLDACTGLGSPHGVNLAAVL